MSFGFEVTGDDVATALERLGLPWDGDLGERWADELNLDEASEAAMGCHSEDMDEQTEAALKNLEKQLRAFGVPEKTLDHVLAEQDAEELDGTTPQPGQGSPVRPRM